MGSPIDGITGTLHRVIRFKPIDFVIELLQLSDNAFDQSRFNRRIKVQSSVLGGSVWLPTPEDVVVQKVRWGRPQDLLDASNVLILLMNELNWSYIYH